MEESSGLPVRHSQQDQGNADQGNNGPVWGTLSMFCTAQQL
jgi:hypothetical protein